MIAIQTKYLGPTNHRGARVKAWTANGRQLTIDYPYDAREGADAHAVAAVELARMILTDIRETTPGAYPFGFDLVAGETDHGYVFVDRNSGYLYSIAD